MLDGRVRLFGHWSNSPENRFLVSFCEDCTSPFLRRVPLKMHPPPPQQKKLLTSKNVSPPTHTFRPDWHLGHYIFDLDLWYKKHLVKHRLCILYNLALSCLVKVIYRLTPTSWTLPDWPQPGWPSPGWPLLGWPLPPLLSPTRLNPIRLALARLTHVRLTPTRCFTPTRLAPCQVDPA